MMMMVKIVSFQAILLLVIESVDDKAGVIVDCWSYLMELFQVLVELLLIAFAIVACRQLVMLLVVVVVRNFMLHFVTFV
ncbi:hypothetical protein Dimus_015679 [Dionaea muscipula]